MIATARLADAILSLAQGPGETRTALPDLWVFQSDQPISLTRGYSGLMNIAVAATGQKRIRTGGLEALNDPGHFVVLPGGRHYQADVTPPYTALKLQFAPLTLAEAFLELADAKGVSPRPEPAPPLFTGEVNDALADALLRLLGSLRDPVALRTLAPLQTKEVILRFLATDAAATLRASIGGEHLAILTILRQIEADPETRVTVAELAERAHMSASHFAHRFREIVSVAPIQYLKAARLRKARVALLAGTPAGRVAEAMGYASASQFSREFRRQFGQSPQAYLATVSFAGSGK